MASETEIDHRRGALTAAANAEKSAKHLIIQLTDDRLDSGRQSTVEFFQDCARSLRKNLDDLDVHLAELHKRGKPRNAQ